MGEEAYRRFLNDKSPSIVEVFGGYQPPGSDASPTELDADRVVHTVSTGVTSGLRIIPSRFDFSDRLTEASRNRGARACSVYRHELPRRRLCLHRLRANRVCAHIRGLPCFPLRPCPGAPRVLRDHWFSIAKANLLVTSIAGTEGNKSMSWGSSSTTPSTMEAMTGGPEKAHAMSDIKSEAHEQGWHIFENQIPHSRGFPKMMRGDRTYPGNAGQFRHFAEELLDTLLSRKGKAHE